MNNQLNKQRPNIVVMISGGGTNLQALIDAIAMELLDARISCVVSNRKAAYGLERAREAGIETLYFPLKPYKKKNRSRYDYDNDLAEAIKAYEPEVIVLAGWMHILSHNFLSHFPGRIINLHPALPGKFDGIDAIGRAYDAYRKMQISYSGCMVHLVVPEVDAGTPVVTAMVPMRPIDSFEDFERRMHRTEHRVIVMGTQIALEAVRGV